jgi:sigma-E factor negative regulatory protein RseC
MIVEEATVVDRNGDTLWIETRRQSACGACGHGSGCGSALLGGQLGGLLGKSLNRLAIDARGGIHAGDRVLIGIPDALLVRASLAAYVLPLLTLVSAAGIAQWLGAADVLVAVVGIFGLAAGLVLTGAITGGRAARERFRPVLIRKLGVEANPPPLQQIRTPARCQTQS